MKRYAVYEPEDFGFKNTPSVDESVVVLVELNDNGSLSDRGMVTYICCDDWETPPFVDLNSGENFEVTPDMIQNITPVIDVIEVNGESGDINLREKGNTVIVTREQYEILASPECLSIDNKLFWRDEAEEDMIYRKDATLANIEPIRLDMSKYYSAVKKKYPALLEKTHSFCGKSYSEFPNAKYFEDRDKAVVFITASQLPEISEKVIMGEEALFRDFSAGWDWNVNNVYGICIIDDSDPQKYEIKLVAPSSLERQRDLFVEKSKDKEVTTKIPVRDDSYER